MEKTTGPRVRGDIYTVVHKDRDFPTIAVGDWRTGRLMARAVFCGEGWYKLGDEEAYLRFSPENTTVDVLAHQSGIGYRYGHHVSGMRSIDTGELFGYWTETKERCEEMMRFLGVIPA